MLLRGAVLLRGLMLRRSLMVVLAPPRRRPDYLNSIVDKWWDHKVSLVGVSVVSGGWVGESASSSRCTFRNLCLLTSIAQVLVPVAFAALGFFPPSLSVLGSIVLGSPTRMAGACAINLGSQPGLLRKRRQCASRGLSWDWSPPLPFFCSQLKNGGASKNLYIRVSNWACS